MRNETKKQLRLTGHCFKLEDEGNHEDCLDGKKTWDQDHGNSGKIQFKDFIQKWAGEPKDAFIRFCYNPWRLKRISVRCYTCWRSLFKSYASWYLIYKTEIGSKSTQKLFLIKTHDDTNLGYIFSLLIYYHLHYYYHFAPVMIIYADYSSFWNWSHQ